MPWALLLWPLRPGPRCTTSKTASRVGMAQRRWVFDHVRSLAVASGVRWKALDLGWESRGEIGDFSILVQTSAN